MNYKLSQIATITDGKLYGEDRVVESISTDSRNSIEPDSLFVALSGPARDGHNYTETMAERGVLSFIVEHEIISERSISFIVVNNTLLALQKLAEYHRSRYSGELIAITGSNGKTIVKEWFTQLWDERNGKLLRSPRSYNSQLGVALSLLMIEGDERFVLIEAGISKPGEMERLEQMIKPTAGILTNIGDAHLQNFSSVEELSSEKEKLFIDSQWVIRGKESLNIDESNRNLVLEIYDKLKLSHKPISELHPLAMRLELKEGVYNSTLIDDGYVNDLSSLRIALDYQSKIKKSNKIVIFSDFEGNYSSVAEYIKTHTVDKFIGIGLEVIENRELFPIGSEFYQTTEEFLQNFDIRTVQDSSVLLKGSRKFAFERISRFLENFTHTTFMEIDLDAMADNLNVIRKLIPKECRTMAMVKADSYGSGSIEVALMLQRQGVDYLAVAFTDEGIALRRAGIHLPIIVLNSDSYSFSAMIEHRLEPEIYSFSSLASFIKAAERVGASEYPIHIKLDTGMHRLGFIEKEIPELNQILTHQSCIKVATVFSHLAASDNPSEDKFTELQITRFKTMAEQLPPALWHICNSAAIRRFLSAHFDMVRLGLGLYIGEQIVNRLKTIIVQIKTVAPPETVGYGREGKIDKPTRIATLPIGYADGLNRRLGLGVGGVLIRGALCPFVGNICMDTSMVDLSHSPDAEEGDEAVIFGNNPKVEELAALIGTIPYEILTSISSRIKRVYING